MKCMSCEAEIPAAWKAALANNICPACGQAIMSDEFKQASDSLEMVIGNLVQLGEESMDQILANHGLMRKPVPGQAPRTGAAPTPHPTSDGELPPGFKIPQNKVQDMLSRSKAPHLANRHERMKEVLNRLKTAESDDIPLDEALSDNSEVSAEEYEDYHNSLLEQPAGVGRPPPTTAEFVNAFGDSGFEEAYDPSLPPALQQDRLKRLQQSRDVATGGGKGGFRRSG